MTFAAMPCRVDHELPNSPDSGFVFREPFGFCTVVDVVNEEGGSGVTLRHDLVLTLGLDVRVGDPSLEGIRDPLLLAASSLCSVEYMSSSTEISLRVRGRNVELLLDDDNEALLVGFMACAHQAEQVELELHTPKECS
jgi:hypothetical protein